MKRPSETAAQPVADRRGDGWFSSLTAWRARHFADASWRPALMLAAAGCLILLAGFTSLAGGYQNLFFLAGLLALAASFRVLIGKTRARLAKR